MAPRKRKRGTSEPEVVTRLRRGGVSILDAVFTELPDVFYGEILPKLDLLDTQNLAQVSKSYNDAVWSVDGVRSMEAKIRTHLDNLNHPKTSANPVYWAARHGNLPAVRVLLKSGVGINKSLMKRTKWTVLHVAAYYDSHAALVKELIKAGADVNMRVCADVKRAGTDPGLELVSNYTALHLAAPKYHLTTIMELIKGGTDVNIACSDGVTPLHIAAEVGHEAGVLALMNAGADINAVTRTGRTPLSLAKHKKNARIVELLKHFGA